MMDLGWPLIKITLISLIYAALNLYLNVPALYCVLICVSVILTYPYVIAFIVPNTIVMPALDQ